MRALIVAVALLFAIPAYAANPVVDTNGLTESQAAKLALDAKNLAERNADDKVKSDRLKAEQAAQANTSMLDKIEPWVVVAKNVGVGLAEAAHALGAEVNTFAQSDVGKITTLIIVYKLMGRDVIHYTVGIVFFFTLFPCWWLMFRRMCLIKSREIDKDAGLTIFRRPRYKEIYFDGKEDAVVGWRIAMLILMVVMTIIGLVVFFP